MQMSTGRGRWSGPVRQGRGGKKSVKGQVRSSGGEWTWCGRRGSQRCGTRSLDNLYV